MHFGTILLLMIAAFLVVYVFLGIRIAHKETLRDVED